MEMLLSIVFFACIVRVASWAYFEEEKKRETLRREHTQALYDESWSD